MSQEPISCACPECGKQFRVAANLAGKRIVCSGCKTKFVVPGGKVSAPVAKPKAAAAAAAPAAGPKPSDQEAPISIEEPIPFDEAEGESGESLISSRKHLAKERIKIEATGHYYVGKVILAGKMVHVTVERALNEYAEQGWRVQHVLQSGQEAYFVMTREQMGNGNNTESQSEPAQ